MKKLILGNEAFARGLYEAGCSFVSSYPGTPSTEITECIAKYPEVYAEWAPNEKVAMEAAFGASLAGKRSFCGMKHVGLNVGADPLFSISYSGVNGGLVICVADDPGMHSSQNEQDSRNYGKAAHLPVLEPSNSQEALTFVKYAYDLSENFDTPVIMRMCTRIAHSQSIAELSPRQEVADKPYVKNPPKYIMMPGYAKLRRPLVAQRDQAIADFGYNAPFNQIEWGTERKLGIITASTSYQYVKEVCGQDVNILKLGMTWPLSEKLLKEFCSQVERVVIVEEGDSFIEDFCKTIGLQVEGKELFPRIGELSQSLVAKGLDLPMTEGCAIDSVIPNRPPALCAGCPHRGIYHVLSKLKLTVIGDIGCYTLGAVAPLNSLDAVVCMGASISGIHGFLKAAGEEQASKTVAVIGDSTFMHSGMTGLVNIAYNNSNSTVIILDNSITGMTGHQQNPTTGFNLKGDPAAKVDLEALCRALGIGRVRVVDPYDLQACETAIREELAATEPSVIISRRPCALLKYVKHAGPIKVDPTRCIGCKMCMKAGCPAIHMKDGKAEIDSTLCTGCGICSQLCKVKAIGGE